MSLKYIISASILIFLLTFYGFAFIDSALESIKEDGVVTLFLASILFVGMSMISIIIINIFVTIMG